jgi:hypothetical protein
MNCTAFGGGAFRAAGELRFSDFAGEMGGLDAVWDAELVEDVYTFMAAVRD